MRLKPTPSPKDQPLPRLPLTGEELLNSPPVKGGLGGVGLPSGLRGVGLPERGGILPYNKKFTERARENRKNSTPTETKIWNEVLRMRQFADYKFLRQKPIDNYIVDFYCSELQLVIEIDGDSHAETVEYDAERTRVLQSLGLTVVRYTNDDVICNIQGVYDHLIEKIEELTPLAPLDRGGLKACLSPPSPVKGRVGEGLVSPEEGL